VQESTREQAQLRRDERHFERNAVSEGEKVIHARDVMAGLKSLLPMTFWFKRSAHHASLLPPFLFIPVEFLSLPFV
jgi:hypothetical protein